MALRCLWLIFVFFSFVSFFASILHCNSLKGHFYPLDHIFINYLKYFYVPRLLHSIFSFIPVYLCLFIASCIRFKLFLSLQLACSSFILFGFKNSLDFESYFIYKFRSPVIHIMEQYNMSRCLPITCEMVVFLPLLLFSFASFLYYWNLTFIFVWDLFFGASAAACTHFVHSFVRFRLFCCCKPSFLHFNVLRKYFLHRHLHSYYSYN